jgi:hypothetical protein
MKIDELNDLLIEKEEKKVEASTPPPHYRLPSLDPLIQHVDVINLINRMMYSYDGTRFSLEDIYDRLRNMQDNDQYTIVRIDIDYNRRYSNDKSMIIELWNGTRLVYRV